MFSNHKQGLAVIAWLYDNHPVVHLGSRLVCILYLNCHIGWLDWHVLILCSELSTCLSNRRRTSQQFSYLSICLFANVVNTQTKEISQSGPHYLLSLKYIPSLTLITCITITNWYWNTLKLFNKLKLIWCFKLKWQFEEAWFCFVLYTPPTALWDVFTMTRSCACHSEY